MILVTHGFAGALAARAFSWNPVAAMIAAFLSHFALDMIPHWHYPLRSKIGAPDAPLGERFGPGRLFARDALIVALDGISGIALSIIFAPPEFEWLALWGAGFGILPDFLQFLAHYVPHPALREYHRIHRKIHTRIRLDDRPFLGIGSQAALGAVILALLRL